MFENAKKKNNRVLITSKSTSIAKIPKKQLIEPIYTENTIKEKKNKSQCLSKDRKVERKSIDVSKFVQTTRSSATQLYNKKLKQRNKPQHAEQIFAENQQKHQNFLVANLQTEKSTELKWIKKTSLKKNEGRSAQKSNINKVVWNQKQTPYDWHFVVTNFKHLLTKYECSEIRQYKKVYYIGQRAKKKQKIEGLASQEWHEDSQFDNIENQYEYAVNDHIAYRYEILGLIGKGSYGQVFKVYDHKHGEEIALKMIKNKTKFSQQAFVEIKILTHIKENDPEQLSNIVRIKDFLIFRKHVCLLFELLSQNLYELIIRNNYSGLNFQLIRRFAIQILSTLQFLRSHKIIHCDLKPENILLKEYNKSGIKIIDFGSSCFEKEKLYTYIQSRYYRAPEVALGVSYGMNIDIWSTGCILAELCTGVPLFPGQSECEQIKYMTDTLGRPGLQFLNKGSRSDLFFTSDGEVKEEIKKLNTIEHFSKPLAHRIDDLEFLSFIELFLKWEPEQRISPIEALNHSWIRKGLPEDLRNKLMPSSNLVEKQQERNYCRKAKSKSREKTVSLKKNTNRASEEKLVKRYGIKF